MSNYPSKRSVLVQVFILQFITLSVILRTKLHPITSLWTPCSSDYVRTPPLSYQLIGNTQGFMGLTLLILPTQIEPEEPKWLLGGSHTSVFNGPFWLPGDPDTCTLSGEPKWIQLVRKGPKCPNGSRGSSKSSFSFMCADSIGGVNLFASRGINGWKHVISWCVHHVCLCLVSFTVSTVVYLWK